MTTEAKPASRAGASNKPASNGQPTEIEFPVETFRDAAQHLRRPFTSKAVKFKVQATWPKGDPKSGLIVAYVDARTVVERLNHVCPHLWFDEYTPLYKRLMCALTLDGITRRDVGEGYEGKGLYSDALKRAGVKFGVGVSLYAIPKMVLEKGTHLKDAKAGQTKTLALTEAGEKRCRELYTKWLAEHGIAAFGQPLDHGDVENAVGDQEVTPVEPNGSSEPEARALPAEKVTALEKIIGEAGIETKHLDAKLRSFGAKQIADLTVEQGIALWEWISDQKGGE